MMKFTPPRRALILWRIYASIVMILALILCAFLGMVMPLLATVILLIVLICFGAFLIFYYLPKLKDSMIVTLTPDAVAYTRGVFINRKYVMPRPRMIYTEHFNTPLSAAMGLANLRLRAARGKLTVFSLAAENAAVVIHETGNDFRGEEND